MNGVDYKFYRAIRKYGFDSFTWEIVERTETIEELKSAEIRWIKTLDCQRNGYNTTSGGDGAPGIEFTPELRAKISARQKKRFQDPIERAKAAGYAREWNRLNPELALAAREKRVATLRTQEHRKRASIKQCDYVSRVPDYRQKRGAAVQALYESRPDIAKRISATLGGKPFEVYRGEDLIGTFDTIAQCAKKLNLSTGNIGLILSGKSRRTQTNGYRFKHVGEPFPITRDKRPSPLVKPVEVIKDGNVIATYPTIADCGRAFSLSRSRMHAIVLGGKSIEGCTFNAAGTSDPVATNSEGRGGDLFPGVSVREHAGGANRGGVALEGRCAATH